MTHRQKLEQLFAYLNRHTGRSWKASRKDGTLTANGQLALDRILEGYSGEDFALVIRWKRQEWGNDPDMRKYLRPTTLFRKTNFPEYLAQARSAIRSQQKAA